MTVHTTARPCTVPSKPDSRRSNEPPARVELRIVPELLKRLQRQADRIGLSVSAYIRRAAALEVQRDEATDPDLQEGGE